MSAPLSDREWLLKIANEVERDPSRWTKGQYFRDKAGRGLSIERRAHAVCWCASGFLGRDWGIPATKKCPGVIAALKASGVMQRHWAKDEDVPCYNDSLADAAEFVTWFRRAAELCT